MLTHRATSCRIAAIAALVLAGDGRAAPAPEKPQTQSSIEKVRKELDRIVTIEFTEQTLDSAINLLRQETKLNLSLDNMTLAQMNIDASAVTLTNMIFRDVKAKVALRSILTPLNLTWVVVGDAVIVTTEEMALYRLMTQRISVDLDQVELTGALRTLTRESGVSLILDPRLMKEGQTRVTLQAEDISLESAVRLLSEMAGLKPVRLGNILYITGKANAAELRAEAELVPTPRSPLLQASELINGIGPAAMGKLPAPPAAVPALPAAPPPAPVPK